MEMARWSQQEPRSWKDLEHDAASGSPVFSSCVPIVMRVRPSSPETIPESQNPSIFTIRVTIMEDDF